ncbi:MAG TPA: response regulator [Burkholderiales bacterium]|nr:response regulator [Burkholderiales bacterium]
MACETGSPAVAPRILIADDEPPILLSLQFLMRDAGYEVDTARDGEEALHRISVFRPHLLILDVMLPQIDGFEVCRRVRACSRSAGTRIIMLTARGRDADVQTGLAAGADAYLTKPFGTRELLDKTAALLGRAAGGENADNTKV